MSLNVVTFPPDIQAQRSAFRTGGENAQLFLPATVMVGHSAKSMKGPKCSLGVFQSIDYSQKANVVMEECKRLLMNMFHLFNRVHILNLGTIF